MLAQFLIVPLALIGTGGTGGTDWHRTAYRSGRFGPSWTPSPYRTMMCGAGAA